MKLGYSNYGMRDVDIFEALPRIRSIGYEAMELCARDGWQTTADNFGAQDRKKLSAQLQEAGFPTPPIMEALDVCAEGDARAAMMLRAEATFGLASDLNHGDGSSVVTTTIGKPDPDWDTGKSRVRDGFMELADLASRHNVIVAAEPHAGGNFNTPEKAVWLMQNTRHEHLKLNFDVSHFVAQGIDMRHGVDLCVPYAVHTHVKDGYTSDGNVHYLLPGDGQMSLVDYMASVKQAGLTVPIYVEVSRQLSERPGFDSWRTAEYCFRKLDDARIEAARSIATGRSQGE